jgi:hypothetical protein
MLCKEGSGGGPREAIPGGVMRHVCVMWGQMWVVLGAPVRSHRAGSQTRGRSFEGPGESAPPLSLVSVTSRVTG